MAEEETYERISPANNQTLERKGYVLEGKLTPTGIALMDSLAKEVPVETAKRKVKRVKSGQSSNFDSWWSNYPATTAWGKWTGENHKSRALKIKKPGCEEKYMNLINAGASPQKLIDLVNHHVNKLQKTSTTDNEMRWMPSSERWFNTLSYEDALEAMEIEKRVPQMVKVHTEDRDKLF